MQFPDTTDTAVYFPMSEEITQTTHPAGNGWVLPLGKELSKSCPLRWKELLMEIECGCSLSCDKGETSKSVEVKMLEWSTVLLHNWISSTYETLAWIFALSSDYTKYKGMKCFHGHKSTFSNPQYFHSVGCFGYSFWFGRTEFAMLQLPGIPFS